VNHKQKSTDFQYGIQETNSLNLYGLQIKIVNFDGEGNPSGFGEWVGAEDNNLYFYQAGIWYWGNCGYTAWAVDNYPRGGNNGLGIGCPANAQDQYNYKAVNQ
jgi:hypothetical protein